MCMEVLLLSSLQNIINLKERNLYTFLSECWSVFHKQTVTKIVNKTVTYSHDVKCEIQHLTCQVFYSSGLNV